ncbi:hypothetical protein GGR57DRAFT_500985 [Xylariaceae sp. FL1272]|nr:hypothetical protein GGR57DRAFT_500985 [Xylariaceae sp. FL1272]
MVNDLLHNEPITRSGFAPMHPSLHPRYYSDAPTASELQDAGIFTDGTEEDRFYTSLTAQERQMEGVKHWQIGVMNDHVNFGAPSGKVTAGHKRPEFGPHSKKQIKISEKSKNPTWDEVLQRIYDVDTVKVDEAKWLSFFKKDRWYDLEGPSASLGGRSWSIDDPEVWNVLKRPMELANRILLALIEDKHEFLETMLYGLQGLWPTIVDAFWPDPKPQPVDPNDIVLISYNVLKDHCDAQGLQFPLDGVEKLTPAEWRTRLESLLNNVTWTFLDDNPYGHFNHNPTAENMISIGVRYLETLMTSDITLAERCYLEVSLANTVLHELTHALNYARFLERGWPDPEPWGLPVGAIYEEAVGDIGKPQVEMAVMP